MTQDFWELNRLMDEDAETPCLLNTIQDSGWQNYPPLSVDDKQIRLFRLFADNNCTLEVFDLDKAPPFNALSYAWHERTDHEGRLCQIKVNGQPRRIAYNLWSFLDHQGYRAKDRYLWVDAICIDQRSIVERGHQVSIMRTIFSRAQKVLTWIGEETTALDIFFEAISVEKRSGFDLMDMRNDTAQSRMEIGEALEIILARRYWSRVWIVQETILARDLTICCGKREVQADMLYEICCTRFLENVPYPRITFAGIATNFEARFKDSHATKILRARKEFSKTKAIIRSPFEEVFTNLSSGRSCSDRRDQVFALLSLSSDEELKADYSLTTQEVFFSTLNRTNVKRSVKLARNLSQALNLDVEPMQSASENDTTLISTRVLTANSSWFVDINIKGVPNFELTCVSLCTCDEQHEPTDTGEQLNCCGLTGVGCFTSREVEYSDQVYWLPDTTIAIFVRSEDCPADKDETTQDLATNSARGKLSIVDIGRICQLNYVQGFSSKTQYTGDTSESFSVSGEDAREMICTAEQGTAYLRETSIVLDKLRKAFKTACFGDAAEIWCHEIRINETALYHAMKMDPTTVKTIDPRMMGPAARRFPRQAESLQSWGRTRYERSSLLCRCHSNNSSVNASGICSRCGRSKVADENSNDFKPYSFW